MMYKGVIHMHSTHSYDGKETLKDLRSLLTKKGVSFACMTEHTDELTPAKAEAFVRECRELSDSEFVFVPGFEVPYQHAHVLMIGATEFVTSVADAEGLKRWASISPIVVLAHPVRNRFRIDNTLHSVIDGVEVWNQQYDGKLVPRTRSMRFLRKLRETKPTLLAWGGLDFHREEHFGSPQLMVGLDALTEDAILRDLAKGTFSFGDRKAHVSAKGEWQDGSVMKLRSAFSIAVIGAGKRTNALMKMFGISLPKRWKRAIRSKL